MIALGKGRWDRAAILQVENRAAWCGCEMMDPTGIIAIITVYRIWLGLRSVISRSVNQNCFRNYYNVRVIIGSDHARYEPNKQLVRFGREAGCEFVAPQMAQRGPAPAGQPSSGEADSQGPQRKQSSKAGQGHKPSARTGNLNQGIPTIHSPDQLKGMKPGSLFRAPDGCRG
jgi:hypothetical protein